MTAEILLIIATLCSVDAGDNPMKSLRIRQNCAARLIDCVRDRAEFLQSDSLTICIAGERKKK